MERSVFEIVKAPLGWSVFADNVKIGGVYDFAGRRPRSRCTGRVLYRQRRCRRSDQRARRGGRKA